MKKLLAIVFVISVAFEASAEDDFVDIGSGWFMVINKPICS